MGSSSSSCQFFMRVNDQNTYANDDRTETPQLTVHTRCSISSICMHLGHTANSRRRCRILPAVLPLLAVAVSQGIARKCLNLQRTTRHI